MRTIPPALTRGNGIPLCNHIPPATSLISSVPGNFLGPCMEREGLWWVGIEICKILEYEILAAFHICSFKINKCIHYLRIWNKKILIGIRQTNKARQHLSFRWYLSFNFFLSYCWPRVKKYLIHFFIKQKCMSAFLAFHFCKIHAVKCLSAVFLSGVTRGITYDPKNVMRMKWWDGWSIACWQNWMSLWQTLIVWQMWMCCASWDEYTRRVTFDLESVIRMRWGEHGSIQ